MAARARGSYEDSMKDAQHTRVYRTTYLLPLVSERIFSFPLFHLTKKKEKLYFSISMKGETEDLLLLIGLFQLLSISFKCRPFHSGSRGNSAILNFSFSLMFVYRRLIFEPSFLPKRFSLHIYTKSEHMWKKLMMLLNHRLTFDRWGATSAHVGRFYIFQVFKSE